MLRILLFITLIVGAAVPGRAEADPPGSQSITSAVPSGQEIEYLKVVSEGRDGYPPLARCANIRIPPQGQAEKTRLFCVFYDSNGNIYFRTDTSKSELVKTPFPKTKDMSGARLILKELVMSRTVPDGIYSKLGKSDDVRSENAEIVVDFLVGDKDAGLTPFPIKWGDPLSSEAKDEDKRNEAKKIYDRIKTRMESRSSNNSGQWPASAVATPEHGTGASSAGEQNPAETGSSTAKENGELKNRIAELESALSNKKNRVSSCKDRYNQFENNLYFVTKYKNGDDLSAIKKVVGFYAPISIPFMSFFGNQAGVLFVPLAALLLSLIMLFLPPPQTWFGKNDDDEFADVDGKIKSQSSLASSFNGIKLEYVRWQGNTDAEVMAKISNIFDVLSRYDGRFLNLISVTRNFSVDLDAVQATLGPKIADFRKTVLALREAGQADNAANDAEIQHCLQVLDASDIPSALNVAIANRNMCRIYETITRRGVPSGGAALVERLRANDRSAQRELEERLFLPSELSRVLQIGNQPPSYIRTVVAAQDRAVRLLSPPRTGDEVLRVYDAVADQLKDLARIVSDSENQTWDLAQVRDAFIARRNEADQKLRDAEQKERLAAERTKQAQAVRELYAAWRRLLIETFGPSTQPDNVEAQVEEWAATVAEGRARVERNARLTIDLEAEQSRSETRWRLAALLLQRIGRDVPDPAADGEAKDLLSALEREDDDLFFLRAGVSFVTARLAGALDALREAGGGDVATVLGLGEFAADLDGFCQNLTALDPAIEHPPTDYWDKLVFPSIQFLHRLMRAELVLRTYFDDQPTYAPMRNLLGLAVVQMEFAARKAGVACRRAPLLQAPPVDAATRYQTVRAFRDIPEIRKKVLERERLGGEFSVDLHTAGFSAPFTNTALTLVLFNPADWI